ncbi:MAG: peptidyl-prolyl cis-trans isomerase [Deltaproteobacteria bacterium]|nr:peptidyl-prolyl cis-trans isomerase [Deltaproteobacteria bacterium]
MPNPIVEVQTTLGNIKIELDQDKAPASVENFLAYLDSGHYAGTIFHRVIRGFMAQGGGYDGSYEKKPTRPTVQNEADNGLKNLRGTVAMARTSEPHSATAQFFFNLADNGFLDHREKTADGWGYTVFGKVVEGMDMVDQMATVPTGAKGPFRKDAPQQEIVINLVNRCG